ncbi:MAG TPA: hypothetical protein VFR09_07380, partial [Alphaproteobacteria bacterium]|nr:hypothetical protein [Alphaproteobacteria bacterium]
MSVPEVFHRLGEAVRHHVEARTASIPPAYDYGALPAFPGLREAIDGVKLPKELTSVWNAQFNEVKNDEFYLLNQKWPKTIREQRWHRDPVTGKFWPQLSYAHQVSYRDNPNMGDIKYV